MVCTVVLLSVLSDIKRSIWDNKNYRIKQMFLTVVTLSGMPCIHQVTQHLGGRPVPQHARQPGLFPGQHGDERQRAQRESPVRRQEGRLLPLHLHIPRQGGN